MANDFLSAYTKLLSMVNRPSSETDVLNGAKLEINNAIRFLQRDHAYAYTEALQEITVLSGTPSVSVSALAAGIFRNILSAQQLSSTGQLEGKPLTIKSYAQIQKDRFNYLRRHSAVEVSQFDSLTDFSNVFAIEEGYRTDKIAYVIAQNIGLYPRQGSDVKLLLHYNAWLPELTANGDLNFFLEYALDLVLMLALRRMHIHMKTDTRYEVSAEEVKDNLATLIAWDSQVRESPSTTNS